MFEGYWQDKHEHQQELISLAWHIEAFARQKKLPALAKLLKESEKPSKTNSTEFTQRLLVVARSKGLKVPGRREE